VAAGILRPSLLLNVKRDEPVQAHCVEPRCPGMFDLAGWRSDLPGCDACLVSPSPLAVESEQVGDELLLAQRHFGESGC
jgi:hypothetical protein